MTPESPPAPSAFGQAEWEKTREQVRLLLSFIWRFEGFVLAGYAAYFSWNLTILSAEAPPIDPDLLVAAGLMFLAVIVQRLKVEYAILIVLSQYSMGLEEHLYRGGPAPIGWEIYLSQTPPDKIRLGTVFRRYSNTGVGLGLLALSHVALLAIHHVTWLKQVVSFAFVL